MLYSKWHCEKHDGTNICRNRGKRRFFRLESWAGFMMDWELALSYWNYLMILILVPNNRPNSSEYKQLMAHLANFPWISARIHTEVGTEQTLIEIYLIGNTKVLSAEEVSSLPCVDRVGTSEEYRVLGGTKMQGIAAGTIWCCLAVRKLCC